MGEVIAGVSLARITPPPVPSNFLFRDHLLAKFSNPEARTLFISAPSGYGKTTLAAQWAAQHPEASIWYTPGAGDSILEIYFHIVQAARKIIPDFAPWVQKMKKNEPDLKEFVVALANEFAQLDRQITIIFDHLDDLPKGSGQMSRMWAEHQPMNVRSVGIRRSMLTPELTELLVPSAQNYISAADMRLTSEEEVQIMETFGISASDVQSREILAKAQGWPSAFALLCKRLSGSKEEQLAARHFMINLDGTNLLNKALTSLSDADRNFMKKLSLSDIITPELAEAISQDPQAKIRLARLSFEGLYFNCINLENEEYEMNGLIKEKFEAELAGDPAFKRDLQLLLAEIYSEKGDEISAVDIFQKMGRSDLAEPILKKIYAKLVYSGDHSRLTLWAKKLAPQVAPTEIGEEIVLAFASLVMPKLEDAQIGLERLESVAKAAGLLDEVEIYRDIMKAKIAFSQGRLSDVKKIQSRYTEAKQLAMGEAKELVAAITRNASAAAFLLEDFETLSELTLMRPQLVPELHPERFSEKPHSINGLYIFATGDFRQAREYAQNEWQIASRLNLRGLYYPYESLYVLTETLRELGDVDGAITYAESALIEARRNELWPWVAGFQSKIAYCEFQRGNKTLAFKILRQTRDELLKNQVHSEGFRIIDEHELVIRSAAKDLSRGKELLARLPKTPTVEFILQANIYSKKSIRSTEEIAAIGEENIRAKLNKLILLAENSGSSSLAQEHAMAALRIGFEFGYQEIFLSRGDVFNQIILDLAATHSLVYLENLATLVRERSFKEVSDDRRLTSRELDILRNLATGRPLIQIAKSLHISQNTMKTHLRNVYRKLGADSRDSATKIARDQLLI